MSLVAILLIVGAAVLLCAVVYLFGGDGSDGGSGERDEHFIDVTPPGGGP